jgi:hypothetical protein
MWGEEKWRGAVVAVPALYTPLWGPPSLLSSVYQELFLWGAKQPGREADHSPPSMPRSEMVDIYHTSS